VELRTALVPVAYDGKAQGIKTEAFRDPFGDNMKQFLTDLFGDFGGNEIEITDSLTARESGALDSWITVTSSS
jgi:hypothetical protein